MLKANKKTLLITCVVTLLPILAGILLWNRLPDMMATHFNMNNEADGFSSKAFAVFVLPLFLLAVQGIVFFVTANDPRRSNISPKMLTLVLWIVPVVSLICAGLTYSYSLGYRMNTSFIMGLMMGLLFIIMGNFMPKARHNYTIGIRVPWTLADEGNWNRTHRFAGFLWVIGGVLILILTISGLMKPGLVIGAVLVMSLVPTVYSFLDYKRHEGEAM